jgi:NAD(P)-dependent dehydrogenase (short-subunit alcohol dehydrogenase family)
MADLDGTTGIAGGSHHCAAVAGIIGFTKSVAREVAMQGIPVSAIVPRYIDTPLLDLAGEGRATQVAFIGGRTLLGGWAKRARSRRRRSSSRAPARATSPGRCCHRTAARWSERS